MLKLLENHVKATLRTFLFVCLFVFHIFNLGNIFENFDKRRQKNMIFAKKSLFRISGTFGQSF